MPLDVALLGENGEPQAFVAVSASTHMKLMWVADQAGLVLLQRMSDYYEDCEFEADEMPELRKELDRAQSHASDDELQAVIAAVRGLTERASAHRRGLVAIAD